MWPWSCHFSTPRIRICFLPCSLGYVGLFPRADPLQMLGSSTCEHAANTSTLDQKFCLKNSSPVFPWSLDGWPSLLHWCSPNTVMPVLCLVICMGGGITKRKNVKGIYSLIFLSPVGWSRTSSRLCRTTKRDPDAVAPIHSQTLPHAALWVLKPRHAGRGSRRPAELGCRELEGMASSLQYKNNLELWASLKNDTSIGLKKCNSNKYF